MNSNRSVWIHQTIIQYDLRARSVLHTVSVVHSLPEKNIRKI